MKILYLTKYTRMAGSSRMRSYQYFPYLEKAGMQVTVKPFFDDAYLKDFYAGTKNISAVVKSYIKRLGVLFSVFRYDRVVIEKEIFPFLPALAEWMLKLLGIQYIVDYDDAIFHNYDQSANPIIKNFLGNKIAYVMRFSGTVVAGNQYLADYAARSGAKNIEIIPTVIDLDRYPIKQTTDTDPCIVGWIGTKTTFEKHLLPCKDWIKALQHQEPNIRFHIVGITEDMDLGKNVKYIRWTEETEVAEILKMDIGLMPLQDSKWEKGKCAYKLIQYSACGIPGVASDVGMNREVTVPGETGILASADEEWIQAIKTLKSNTELRQQLGRNARKKVEERYCIQQTSTKWKEILNH
ncbi:glycosyltransferase family 4 protein [Chryseobacterium sp. VAUSW3]|uniref:glycosyltransferase family 4 protein n=1 Tax=Chryseobacterium sp. VAUSW3 TaxID=2010998 RepID=UPI000B4DDE50|nr:glycosyltransferase family 4 protein [Chryseobacterium sp. VAUSW3]OWR15173.1 glycosyltransferase [Chryseobacterium sp. VAUSW3]